MSASVDTIVADIRYLRKAHDEFSTEVKQELKEIRLQTQKTNGRMTRAEDNIVAINSYHLSEETREDKKKSRFSAPMITGCSVGAALAVFQLILRTMFP